jgi:hypothetical protein
MSEQPECPRLNAIGKPLSPSYDPNYKIKTPLSSINHLRKPMPPGVLREPMNPDEEQRWKAVKECITKGDKLKSKAEDFYITAGQQEHTGTWLEWEIKLKERAGLGKSRASELMQIADGTKTVEKVGADTAKRTADAKKRLSATSGESADPPQPEGVRRIDGRKDIIVQSAGKTMGEVHAEVVAKMMGATPGSPRAVAEELQAAKIKIAGLESEVEELKAENARLRAELEAKQETATKKQGDRPKTPPAVAAVVAALDHGADPGPFPENLRRAPA